MSREPMDGDPEDGIPAGPDDSRLDDARLTAHAMGEEHGSLSPEEQAEVDAIRATAETLRAGFATVPMPVLDPARRAAILGGLPAIPAALSGTPQGLSLEAAKPHPGTVPGPVVRLSDYSGLGALAATLLLVVGLTVAGVTDLGRYSNQGSNPYVKTFSAPNYSGVYRDEAEEENLELVVSPSGRSSPPGDAFNYSTIDIPAGVSVKIGGTLPPTLLSTRTNVPLIMDVPLARDMGFGGAGGGGGRQYGAAGYNFPLPNRTSLSRAGGSGIQGSMSLAKLEAATKLPFNIGKGGFEEWVSNGNTTATFGNLRDVKDVTAGIRIVPADDVEMSTEASAPFVENAWIRPYGEAALSTFSIDVDTAGYSIVRRSLVEQNRMPSPGALRIEELVNYFPYAYDGPVSADPFAVHVDAAACPWEPTHRLVRIALKGREIEEAARPAANLVFLLDVSGSMNQPNKLPLVKQSIAMLAERLTVRDRVAMVVYAGSSGLVLPSTPAGDHGAIQAALDRLGAGGSTNGGAGIELAYKVATENFVAGGINRVVLATDGDFNVGVSDPSALVKMVEEKARAGVFLTALGYGMDNLKDSTLEQLADKGNGNYGYIDNLGEARKVLVEQGMSTLHCIAKDVKIQVEFNPAKVAGYRLLGYENRMLAAQEFADDTKDAGEIGAGHTVTALYEVVPAGVEVPGGAVDELRYQRPGSFSGNAESLVVKLRWKAPEGTVSTPREFPFVDGGLSFESASADFRFASAVAAFGMVLRDSKCAGSANLDLVREIAAGSLGGDAGGYRAEFLTLVAKAKTLKK